MRRRQWLVAALALLAIPAVGCGGDDDDDTEATTAVANPASVYCKSQGGTVVIVTAADGSQGGRCRLADGSEVDEWEYYRESQPTATSDAAPPTT